MKKVILRILSLFMAIVFINLQTFANSYSVASTLTNAEEEVAVFDEAEIYDAFNEVDELVSLLETKENITYAEVENIDVSLVENVSANAAVTMNTSATAGAPIISAFLWGCLFSIFGMGVVALTTGFDSDEIRSSFWGCVINAILTGPSLYYYN